MNKSNPENHGKPWSDEDENLLLKKLSKGETLVDIAEYFKRTEGGIRSRQRELAYRFVEDGKTVEEAAKFTYLSVEDVEKSMKQRSIAAKINNQKREKEETLLSVVIEIRDLLKLLVHKI